MTVRVLQIISGFAVEGPLGGIERFGIELSKALDKSRVTSIVCGLWAYGTPFEHGWVEHLQAHGIEAFMPAQWDEASPYASFSRAMRALRQMPIQVDAIHSHCQFGDVAALLLKNRYGAKHLLRTVHNEREWGKRPFRRLMLTNGLYPLRFQPELGVAQEVVNNLDARPLAKLLGRKAQLQYNALNIERFKEIEVDRNALLSEFDIPANAQVVGTVGRLSAQKGIDVLIDSAEYTIKACPNTYYLIVGTGDLESQLKAKVANLPFSDRIRFAGARNNVEQLLTCFDVFVNSSLWEGLPTVIMEAMAARVPVVATNVGGNAELISHNTRGYLVDPNSPEKLADAIITVLRDPQVRNHELVENSAEFVKNTFAIKTVAQNHEKLYLALQ